MPSELPVFSSSEICLPDPSQPWEKYSIGCGGFAYVYKVKVRKDDECKDAAFKRFKIDERRGSGYKSLLQREASTLHRLNHKNIIQIIGVCYDEQFFGLLLELCEGLSLGSAIRKLPETTPLSLAVAVDWAQQIVDGMVYLVKQRLVHRDLKADNVLVKEKMCYCRDSSRMGVDWCVECGNRPMNKLTLKITDFGFTKNMMSAGTTVAGSYFWMAPEAFNQQAGKTVGKFNWTEFADVWSFGVVMWEILARVTPHRNLSPEVTAYQNAMNGQTLIIPEDWPEHWKGIMRQCWLMEPEDRPRFQELEEELRGYKAELKEEVIIPYYEFIEDNEHPKNNENLLHGSEPRQNLKVKRRRQRNYTPYQIAIPIAIIAILLILLLVYFLLPKMLQHPTDCPETFHYFDETGYCYKTGDTLKTFEQAQQVCSSLNSTLASIHSDEENSFVTRIVKKVREVRPSWQRAKEFGYQYRFWIGLENNEVYEDWKWLDGSEFYYYNWENNATVNDDMKGYSVSVVINTGKWRKEPMLLGNYYICKTNAF